ncbi:reverse transcriptase-like protein [Alteribacter lacisalsi]|uniref:reverse transcriptase-like protein n=1 Tax=Alteribacter lacisalsi TaxID=2045244 RepID=UPI002686CBAB|nr:reverse transcriptase-like protein [Alteribacter lacisalsi]
MRITEVYIDGASAGNPGPSGAGIFIKTAGGDVMRISVPLGSMTNHHAEFAALVEALKVCRREELTLLSVRTDAQIVADAMEKRYVKREEFKVYLDQALTLADEFDFCFVKWVPSRQNREADGLAKRAIKMNEQP